MTGAPLRLLAIALLAAAALLPWRAMAQTSVAAVPVNGGSLSIERNQGKLVRLAKAASSIFIANPAVADVTVKSARLVYVFGKVNGTTTLFAVDNDENVVADLRVVVTHNLNGLEESLGGLVPAGEIRVASVEGGLVISGAVPTATDAENARRLATRYIGEGEEVINRLQVTEPNQVNLRVRIAEVSRDVLNRFGVNVDAAYISGTDFIRFLTDFTVEESTNFVQGQYDNGNFDFDGLIDALSNDGLVTILAEPNLTALSGETASFLAGGEFPIPVSQDEDSVSIEFKEFGVSLAFTPTIIGQDRINMQVRPEVSSLSTSGAVTLGGFEIPALTTRRAETTVELSSGQSFAIAGLLRDDTQELVQKTPGLGDLPILGALFTSERYERNETELVIVVTPYIVRPVNGNNIPLPTDQFTVPTGAQGGTPLAELPDTVPIPTASSAAAPARSTGYLLD